MFNGAADVIADALRSDVLSGQASAWVSYYPDTFAAGATSVPVHFYTSLMEIWGVSDVTKWQNEYVVSIFGLGASKSATIDVCSYRIMDQVDWPVNSPKINESGAEGAEIHIYLKMPDKVPDVDYNRIAEAERRIRRIIDYNLRVNTRHKAYFTSSGAMIRNDRPLKVYWQGAIIDDVKSAKIVYYAYYSLLELADPPGQ